MLEYEKKVLLTQREYEELLRLAPQAAEPQMQVNYYYDTDDYSMNRRGITCRIREENGKWNATVKYHRRKTDCSYEKTKRVSGKFDTSLFKGMHVKMQGCLTTFRTVLYTDKKLEIVLDDNRYLDHRDYELEIEYAYSNRAYAQCVMTLLLKFLQVQKGCTNMDKSCLEMHAAPNKSERYFQKAESLR